MKETLYVNQDGKKDINIPEKMDCSYSRKVHQNLVKPTVEVKLGDLRLCAVVDTGCTHTMVQTSLVPASMRKPSGAIMVICLRGHARTYSSRKSL